MANSVPTMRDVLAARPHVYRHLRPTPLHHYPVLDEMLDCQVWIKHENHLPLGSFKVRGGLNLAVSLGRGPQAVRPPGGPQGGAGHERRQP